MRGHFDAENGLWLKATLEAWGSMSFWPNDLGPSSWWSWICPLSPPRSQEGSIKINPPYHIADSILSFTCCPSNTTTVIGRLDPSLPDWATHSTLWCKYLWNKKSFSKKYASTLRPCCEQPSAPLRPKVIRWIRIQEVDYQKGLWFSLKFDQIPAEFFSWKKKFPKNVFFF